MNLTNILIIDDNQDLAQGFAVLLEDEGYQVKLAYDGNAGIELFNNGKFDVVLLDIKLPDMNGIEVLHKLHQIDSSAHIIMITGCRMEQVLEGVADSNKTKIIHSPTKIKDILKVVHEDLNIILIVGEEADFGEKLALYLNENNGRSLLVNNIRQAVEELSSIPAEVLILDVYTSIILALETYHEIKQVNDLVKTIVVTGKIKKKDKKVDMLRSPEVTGCLFKPIRPEIMLAAIEEIIA